MEQKRRIMIIILIILVLIIAITFIIKNKSTNNKRNERNTTEEVVYVEKLEDGTEVNMSNKIQHVNKIEGMDGIEIENIQVKKVNDNIEFIATAINKSTETLGNKKINIIFNGKNGEEVISFVGYIDEVKPGEKVKINAKKMTKVECSELYEMLLKLY